MATVPLRTLALLFSAGWGGSYFYNHADGTREVVAATLARTLRFAGGAAGEGHDSSPKANVRADDGALSALSEKVNTLARDVSRAADRPVVVLGPSSSRVSAVADALSLAGWAVVAVGCGSAAYYVAIWKGWSLKDLAWVSQASFNETVETMQKGIARVSGAVAAVRREFGERMKFIEARVEAVRAALSRKIEEEVHEVKTGIGEVSAEVASVHDILADVTGRIDAIDGKLDTATHGIMALVKVVSSLAPDTVRAGNPFWELKQIADSDISNKTPLLKDAQSLVKRRLSSGLGGILKKESAANGMQDTPSVNYATIPGPR